MPGPERYNVTLAAACLLMSDPRTAISSEDPFFVTPRLALRAFRLDDLPDLARINASPTVSRYVDDGYPLSYEDTQRWIEKSRANLYRYGYGTGAVILRETEQIIGWGGFARGPLHQNSEDEELIYGFDEPFWGQGYGTELVVELVRYGLKTLQLTQLRATVYRQNVASVRILTGQGFRLEKSDYRLEPGIDLYRRDA